MSEHRAFFSETVERIMLDTIEHAQFEAVKARQLPTALYDALTENGVMLLLVPEEAGGIGGSVGDAVAVLRAAGAAAAPGPLLETMLGQALLARAGHAPIEGTLTLGFAAEARAGAPLTLYDLPWGGVADHAVVVTAAGIHLTTPQEWTVSAGEDAADEPRDTLSITLLPDAIGVAGCIDEIRRTAAMLRAGQILGATEWTLRRSIDYAGERQQFGREIAKFQVIQQMLADLSGHVLAASGITEAAAETPTDALVAAARSRLGDAADAAIAIGHQVHGALGFSREYALNHRTRRLMAWRDDHGSVTAWRRVLATALSGGDRDSLWGAIVAAGTAPAS